MHVFRLCFLAVLGMLLSVTLVGCGAAGTETEGGNGEEDTTIPASPEDFTAVSGDGAVELEWDGVSADDLNGYNVYRATSPINEVSGRDPIENRPLTGTGYTDESAENGTQYYYRVTAVDSSRNESEPSSEATATPFSDPPDRP